MCDRGLVQGMTRLLTLVAAFLIAAPAAQAADTQLLLVHGYGAHAKGKDCNGDTFKNALRYYQDAGGRARESMTTIGYYPGDKGRCDAMIGDGKATNDRPIQDIAADLANYIDAQGKPVDIVAHSMGGLITRVALLGSAQGWEGFPPKLDVNNVVTLSTPHRGVANTGPNDRQWSQMQPGSTFIERLHEDQLDDAWAEGTDWSLVGSQEDGTVSYDSAIDKGDPADQKFGYLDNGGKVTHTGVRTLFGSNDYHLRYASASGTHTTNNGWSPLKTAFQAATKVGDGLPK